MVQSMKRVLKSVYVSAGLLCCAGVLFAGVEQAAADTSGLIWVDMASQSFGASETDISGFDLRGVWGSAEDNIFVVGPADTMIKFDGWDWAVQSINTDGRELNAVYGTDANNVFTLADSNRGIYYSANGETWARRSSDYSDNALYSLFGLTPDTMIATGNVSIRIFWPVYYYYSVLYVDINNSDNIARATPSAQIHADLHGVWGHSADNVYAVGKLGCKRSTIGLRETDDTTVWHYNGNADKIWTYVDVPADETLYGIWGSAADDIFAVGENGRILHFDGLIWSVQDSPTTQTLRAVWGSAYDDVYAVGDAGTVLHFNGEAWSLVDTVLTSENLKAIWGSSDTNIYIVGSNGTILQGVMCVEDSDCDDGISCNGAEMCMGGVCVEGMPVCGENLICDAINDVCVECIEDADCSEGEICVEGMCEQIPDDPPVIGDGPFVAAGPWPKMSDSSESPTVFRQNDSVLWTFSDDFVSCSELCTHTAEYQVLAGDTWTPVAVSSDAANGYAWVDLPIESLQNATTYALRFSVTDCANQSTQSGTYYFRVATSDAPPVIIDGPFLAAGSWPVFPISESQAFVLNQNHDVLWTFSDDYAICSALSTHLFRYRKVGDEQWNTLPVSTDPGGTSYAYVTLPVESMENGTYEFRMNVRDCTGQWGNSGPKFFKFKVER
jgi:hypothetical protein